MDAQSAFRPFVNLSQKVPFVVQLSALLGYTYVGLSAFTNSLAGDVDTYAALQDSNGILTGICLLVSFSAAYLHFTETRDYQLFKVDPDTFREYRKFSRIETNDVEEEEISTPWKSCPLSPNMGVQKIRLVREPAAEEPEDVANTWWSAFKRFLFKKSPPKVTEYRDIVTLKVWRPTSYTLRYVACVWSPFALLLGLSARWFDNGEEKMLILVMAVLASAWNIYVCECKYEQRIEDEKILAREVLATEHHANEQWKRTRIAAEETVLSRYSAGAALQVDRIHKNAAANFEDVPESSIDDFSDDPEEETVNLVEPPKEAAVPHPPAPQRDADEPRNRMRRRYENSEPIGSPEELPVSRTDTRVSLGGSQVVVSEVSRIPRLKKKGSSSSDGVNRRKSTGPINLLQ